MKLGEVIEIMGPPADDQKIEKNSGNGLHALEIMVLGDDGELQSIYIGEGLSISELRKLREIIAEVVTRQNEVAHLE
eukprot:jgi/Bigna1/64459/fgenesh1_kg.76_\